MQSSTDCPVRVPCLSADSRWTAGRQGDDGRSGSSNDRERELVSVPVPVHYQYQGRVAPPWLAVPPSRYGGIELSVDVLARGLAACGHQVILFATGESACSAPGVEVAWLYPEALGTQNASSAAELNHTHAAYQTLAGAGVDIVHDHTLAGLFVAQTATCPVVTTNHGPFSSQVLADVYRRTAPRVPLISISHHQAASAPPDIPVATVIHHGIDLDRYPFNPTNGAEYVAVLARFSPEKGIDRAIEAARLAGVPLKIAAKCAEPAEHAYYQQVIKPQLGPSIEYVGELDHQAKTELLAGAAALLNPVAWPEPFGLVNIEALACGTPVVATDRGAIPELIDPGTTGYLANTTTELAKALLDTDRIDRHQCRRAAEAQFSMKRMASDHEAFYHQVLTGEPAPAGTGGAV
jgi:glycosyltransferase involved in cell wall biosynthesis